MTKRYLTPVILFVCLCFNTSVNAQALSGPSVIDITDKIDYTKTLDTEPEKLIFKDSGNGALENGVAQINIDPELSKHIIVDSDHPLKVYIQLEGENNGVYVTNRSSKGFWVKEFSEGASNSKFTWRIVGQGI